MEECELCGHPMSYIYGIEIDKVELRVCAKCAKGNRVTYKEEPKEKKSKNPQITVPVRKKPEDVELIENYGEVMRKARERMKLPLKVLAEMLAEKETLLYRVETQHTVPTIELTRKLERALGIKLEQQSENTEKVRTKPKKDEATLGEFIN